MFKIKFKTKFEGENNFEGIVTVEIVNEKLMKLYNIENFYNYTKFTHKVFLEVTESQFKKIIIFWSNANYCGKTIRCVSDSKYLWNILGGKSNGKNLLFKNNEIVWCHNYLNDKEDGKFFWYLNLGIVYNQYLNGKKNGLEFKMDHKYYYGKKIGTSHLFLNYCDNKEIGKREIKYDYNGEIYEFRNYIKNIFISFYNITSICSHADVYKTHYFEN